MPSHSSGAHHGQAGGDFDALRGWLRDDSPVDTPAMDLFHHDDVARRMAERLSQSDAAPTMALIGSLGSGKLTIGKLVEYRLRNVRHVRLIHISLWPFDSTETAVRGILRAIIGELGRHVNVLPLVGLSDDYVTAVEKTAGRYGGIARLLRGTSDPEEVLQQFSGIACAAGLRLVLWIEDLERFSGGNQLEGDLRAGARLSGWDLSRPFCTFSTAARSCPSSFPTRRCALGSILERSHGSSSKCRGWRRNWYGGARVRFVHDVSLIIRSP